MDSENGSELMSGQTKSLMVGGGKGPGCSVNQPVVSVRARAIAGGFGLIVYWVRWVGWMKFELQ